MNTAGRAVMSLPVRILLIGVSTVVWFALAVVGRGGLAAFLSVRPLVALMGVTVVMAVASLFAGGNLSAGEREDRGNRWVLAAFGVLGLALGYLPAWDDRARFLTFDGDTVRWIGIVVYAIGGVFRIWPVFVLGNRFSGLVAIQPGHRLETGGIYHCVRNPSYLGVLMMVGGWALAFHSGIGLILAALIVLPLVGRIRAEEALLLAKFGAEYETYRARTWRLLPLVW